MKLFRKRDLITTAMFLIFGIIAVSIFYSILKPKPTLPIYQPAQVNSKLVDASVAHRIKYHTVSDFNLINQNGDTITQAFYDDKIYVADFFFTTCQSICPVMTKNMKKVQDKLINDKNNDDKNKRIMTIKEKFNNFSSSIFFPNHTKLILLKRVADA